VKKKKYSFDCIAARQQGAAACFRPGEDPGHSLDVGYPSAWLVGFDWLFWGLSGDEGDFLEQEGDFSGGVKIGSASGTLILCRQMACDGLDPYTVCDDESADLEYVMASLTEPGGPMNEATGDPWMDVLYIHELAIEEPLRGQGLGSRILREMPFFCEQLLHVRPELFAYYPAPIRDDWKEEAAIEREYNLRKQAVEAISRSIERQGKGGRRAPLPGNLSQDDINVIMMRKHSGSIYPEEVKNRRLYDFYLRNGFREAGSNRLLYAFVM